MSDTNDGAPEQAPYSGLVETIGRNLDEAWGEVQSKRAHEKQEADQWIAANEAEARQDRQEGFAELVMQGRADTPASIDGKIKQAEQQAMSGIGKKEAVAMQGVGEAKREAAKAPVSWNSPRDPAPAQSQGKGLSR